MHSKPIESRKNIAAAGVALIMVGCGGAAPAPRPTTPAVPTAASGAADDDDDDDDRDDDGAGDDVDVVSTRGKLDPDVVSRALEPHAVELQDCYATLVGRRRWLGGGVELTWDVAANGTVTGVRMSQSDLGSWAIEKCVLEVAHQISFGKPKGGKTSVTMPLSFSAGSGALAWDGDQATRAVGGKPKDLARCTVGTAPTNVSVTLYVGTRGKVQSVGFSSPGGFDAAWADCAEHRAMAWALTDPRGRIAKLSFVYNPGEVSTADTQEDDD